MEAYCTYTPLNPETPENQIALNLAFINQAAPNIKKKFQRLKGFEGKNLTELITIATEVYLNRETPKDKQTWGLAKVLLADKTWGLDQQRWYRMFQISNGHSSIKKDQCAYCKERGHWKKECPLKKRGQKVLELVGPDNWRGRYSKPLLKPWVTLKVEGQTVDFLVDTGAHHSVLKTPLGPLSDKQTWVQGASSSALQPWTTKWTMYLGGKKIKHSFIVIPECPYSLLGRDLLGKMKAQIYFTGMGVMISTWPKVYALCLDLEEEYRLFSQTSTLETSPIIAELQRSIPEV